MAGRPTKLTTEMTNAIATLLDRGLTVTATCGAVSIDTASFYEWLNKGEERGRTPDIYTDFSDAVKKARASVQARWIERIEDAAADPKSWTAAAWLLERSFPQDFGRRTQVEVTVREDVVAEIERLSAQLGIVDPTRELEE